MCYRTWDLWNWAIENEICIKLIQSSSHFRGKEQDCRPFEQEQSIAHGMDIEHTLQEMCCGFFVEPGNVIP